ncbi:hypothetical protein ACFL3B_05145 [Gemmatimonadota bacterium]
MQQTEAVLLGGRHCMRLAFWEHRRAETENRERIDQDRRIMKVTLVLRARAEIVIGVHMVVRNRTVRLAFLLSLTMVVLSLLERYGQTGSADQQATVFLIAGSLAAVVGSRLLAPGGALAASRQVAARFWVVPFGRLTGGVLVVLPVITVAAFSLRTTDVDPLRLNITAAVFAAAVASAVLSLAPAIGGSAAAVAGFVAVWAGVVPPADVNALFERWPFLQRVLALVWNLFPLQWRASRMVDRLHWIDPLVLVGWIVIGVVFTGWFTTPVRSIDRWFRGNVWQH